MKHMNKHLLLILLGFGLIGCDGLEEKEEPKFTVISESIDAYKSPEQFERDARLQKIAEAKKKIVEAKNLKLKELIKRCEEFGFKGNDNIAACVQREIQHDLELAKQEKKMKELESRINLLAESNAQKEKSSSSWLIDVLSVLADEAERQQEFEQQIRLNKLEAQVGSLRASQINNQATCVLNRDC